MVHAIEMGWFILNKYYTLTELVPAYAATILLDPRNRAHYIQQNWPAEWYPAAIDQATRLWEEEYKTDPSVASSGDQMDVDVPVRKDKRQNPLGKYLEKLQVPRRPMTYGDDLTVFMNEPTTDIGDLKPLQWWCLPEHRQRYPRLHRMAIDIFSIPPSSAEPERTFSGARRTQSWDRLRMTAATLERLECIGNWLRNGHIKRKNIGILLSTEEESEAMPEIELDEIEELVSDIELDLEDLEDIIDDDVHSE